MRSADMPGPGSRFGHDVTMRHLTVCARAIAGAASVPAMPAPAAAMNLRRVVMGVSIARRNDCSGPGPWPTLSWSAWAMAAVT